MSLRRWLTQVSALMTKEWKQLYRDRALLSFVIFIFTLDILLASGAPALDLKQTPIGIIDRDHSTLSRELIYKLPAQQFTVVPMADQRSTRVPRPGARRTARRAHHSPRLRRKTCCARKAPPCNWWWTPATPTSASCCRATPSASCSRSVAELVGGQAAAQGRPVVLPQIDIQSRTRFNPSLTEAWYATLSELLTMAAPSPASCCPQPPWCARRNAAPVEQVVVCPCHRCRSCWPRPSP